MMWLLQCYYNVVTSVDLKYGRIKISAKQQQNKFLAENERNKRTAEMIIVNMSSGDRTALTL